MVWSSADKNAERSRGRVRFWTAGDFAGRAQIGHQIAHRQRHADRLFGERLAVRRDHLGAGFHAAAGERDVRGDDDIALAGALRDPVVGGIHAGPRSDALDQRILRHADEIARDHADRQAVPDRDAIDLVLHRAGVGIDIDAGGVQFRHFRSVSRIGFGQVFSSARGTPSGGKMRGKQLLEHACHGTFFAYDNGPERTRNQRKRA